MLSVEPGAGGETLTPPGRPAMNAHPPSGFPVPAPTLFALPPPPNLAYPVQRGTAVLGAFLSAFGSGMAKKNSFYAEQSRNVHENKGSMDSMPIKKRTFPADWNVSERHFVRHKCRWAPCALLFEDWGTAFPGDLRPPRGGAPAAGSLLVGQGPGGKSHRPERKPLAARTVVAQFGRAGGLAPPGGEINSPLRPKPD